VEAEAGQEDGYICAPCRKAYEAGVRAGYATQQAGDLLAPLLGAINLEIQVDYTNWRGEPALRRIIPEKIWFGATKFHPEPQWLLRAVDVDKREVRDFALLQCKGFRPGVRPGS